MMGEKLNFPNPLKIQTLVELINKHCICREISEASQKAVTTHNVYQKTSEPV